MAAIPAFLVRYIPSYGIEPFKDNAGLPGASVTNDNLLITLWSVLSTSPLSIGPLIVPSYVPSTAPVPIGPGPIVVAAPPSGPALEQAFSSRDSARFYMAGGGTPPYVSVPSIPGPGTMLAVLNPPQEYRQKMAGAVIFNDDGTFTIKKSLQPCFLWDVYQQPAPTQSAYESVADSDLRANFSTYLQDATLLIGGLPLAFLRTNGANGEKPLFFDRSTPDGIREMVAEVNRGHFYIAMILSSEIEFMGGYFTIVYPHSAARG